MADDSKITFVVTGKEILKVIKEVKPLLWFLALVCMVLAVVWRMPEIITALR